MKGFAGDFFLCSVINTTSYENLLKLVFERSFILVLEA